MAYGNNSNGGSGAGGGRRATRQNTLANAPFQSSQTTQEQLVAIQRQEIIDFEKSQKPRYYGGQSSGSGIGSGARPSTVVSIFDSSNTSSGSGSGSGIGAPILPPPRIIPDPVEKRPTDPTEIAAKNPLVISNLEKQVFDRSKFYETIDTNFSQLTNSNVIDPSFFDISLATLEDFWTLYEQFFYDIPKDGDTNSHAYLARTSGEYANFELIQEQIQALLDEIAELREENVDLRIENVDLAVSGSTSAAQLQALQA